MGVLQEVAHAVEPLVARPVRDDEPMLVEHLDESGRIALGRDVAPSARARRRDQHERRPGDERPAVGVEVRDLLADRQLARPADDRAERFFRRDGVAERDRIHGIASPARGGRHAASLAWAPLGTGSGTAPANAGRTPAAGHPPVRSPGYTRSSALALDRAEAALDDADRPRATLRTDLVVSCRRRGSGGSAWSNTQPLAARGVRQHPHPQRRSRPSSTTAHGKKAMGTDPTPPTKPVTTEWLAGGGEMGDRMRSLDWSRTPLGPVAEWPQSLRSAVSILLPSKAQIVLFWGPDLVALYNDAYRPVFGAKHPAALGQPARECWREVWDVLEPLFEGVMRTGEAFWATRPPLLPRATRVCRGDLLRRLL